MNSFSIILPLVLYFLSSCDRTNASDRKDLTCYWDKTDGYYIKDGLDPQNGVAWGSFFDEMSQTGWGRLYIESSGNYDDHHTMYCAGYVEGAITAEQIYMWYMSFLSNQFGNGSMSDRLYDFLSNQSAWARDMSEQNRRDPYWHHISLVYSQFDGLLRGYNENTPNSDYAMGEVEMYAFNAAGDLETLQGLFSAAETKLPLRPVLDLSTYRYTTKHTNGSDYPMLDCSGMIKVTPGNKDLLVGHTTWTHYFSMYRVFKNYHLPLRAPHTASTRVAFSSRPGFLNSKDDFYMMDSQLVSQETTNSVMNASLYSAVTPQTVLTWMRVIVANRMANSGEEWTSIFAKYNSGTYNNQWMVVDYKQFTVGQPIRPGTLWILEQIPGYCVSGDVSNVLAQKSYWASYNIPYFSFIYNISGYQGGNAQDGQGEAYVNDVRSRIFARDQVKVVDLDAMKFMMQYNDWQNDSLSDGDPGKSVSSRFDLEPTKPSAFGGIDSKLSSVDLMGNFSCAAISGPTHQQQVPFNYAPWTHEFHTGLPDLWDFDWIMIDSQP